MYQVNEGSGLQSDEKLSTHKFITWPGANVSIMVLKNPKNASQLVAVIVAERAKAEKRGG